MDTSNGWQLAKAALKIKQEEIDRLREIRQTTPEEQSDDDLRFILAYTKLQKEK